MSATTSRPLPECWGHRGVRPPRPLLPATHLESRPPPPGQRTPSPASKAQSKTAPTASSLVRRSSALVVLSSSYVFPDIHVSKDDQLVMFHDQDLFRTTGSKGPPTLHLALIQPTRPRPHPRAKLVWPRWHRASPHTSRASAEYPDLCRDSCFTHKGPPVPYSPCHCRLRVCSLAGAWARQIQRRR